MFTETAQRPRNQHGWNIREGQGEEHPETAKTLYNLACLEALRGDHGMALNWLRQSVEAGYTDADHMAKDSDLASLQGDPEFEAIVAEVKKRSGKED